MIKNISFVNPRDYCKFVCSTPYPPLGVGYLAAVLKQNGYEVDLVDGQILEKEIYEKRILENKSLVIGISATIKQMAEAVRVAGVLKKKNKDRIILLGGSGPNSLLPKDVFQTKDFDILVRGEAEETLPLLLNALNLGSSLDTVPNIVYRDGANKLKGTKRTPAPQDLDKIPFPDRDIYPLEDYLARWKKNTGMTSTAIMSSRGCPFACVFCDKTISGRDVRYRSTKNVVDEMQYLKGKYDLDDIFFYDDLFVCNRERVVEICEEIMARGLELTWSAQARVDRIDMEILQLMRKAGCNEVYFGVESGSNKILNLLGKKFDRKQIIDAFDLCRRAGLKAGAYLIVGVPGETKPDIEETKTLIQKIQPYLINFSFLTPFPNTSLYEKTRHLLKTEDYSKWDEMVTSPYKDECFEVDPKKAHDQIYEVFKSLIKKGMEYDPLQFVCEQ